MKIYGYKITNNKPRKTQITMKKFNPKVLGYRYICTKCKCPLLDDEKICPDCNSKNIKKL